MSFSPVGCLVDILSCRCVTDVRKRGKGIVYARLFASSTVVSSGWRARDGLAFVCVATIAFGQRPITTKDLRRICGNPNGMVNLHVVEDAIRKKIRPRKRILAIPNFFAALVAYVGEMARKETAGCWHLNEVDGGIWEPNIMFDNDKDYINPFLTPYTCIHERSRGGLGLYSVLPLRPIAQTNGVKPEH